ncbi:hypothetical protein OG554_05360 [Streptomyces griseus]|uniref:hypothetical protein n=1 Tax=Streptomyces griseus TaxID=1911 RepID=UPI00386F0520|nr:hypothetical protein OG554_05360 [Streptomyces fimicarius]
MHSDIHHLLHSLRADELPHEAPQFSSDPHRAAIAEALSTVAVSSLSSHREHRAGVGLVKDFTRGSKSIVDEWAAYCDAHTDLDGWPEDDLAYDRRQQQRDADIAALFEPIQGWTGRLLLATAEVQLASLPTSTVQPRWGYQIGVLRDSLDQLDALEQKWTRTVDGLAPGEGPGTPSFEAALAEHHAESWSSFEEWMTHAPAVLEINTAARHGSSPLAPAPVAAPAPAPGLRSPSRR